MHADETEAGTVAEFSRSLSRGFGKGNFPDPDYENSPDVRDVLCAIRSKAPVVFVSGRAGSGKSRLINYLKEMPEGDRQVVVAPTGIAALGLNAMTIHSAFRLPLGVLDASRLDPEEEISKVFRSMTRLIIDEISMVRADLLDGIDARLKNARRNNRPFGGVQVVLVGDFLQLPPVVSDEDRHLLAGMGYKTPYAFSSRVLQGVRLRVAALTKVWRQNDPEMIQALGEIREGRNVPHAVSWFNTHCARPHRAGVVPLLLTATRSSADAYNRQGYDDLIETASGEISSLDFIAEHSGVFSNSASPLPAPAVLRLVPGLRVMAVRNCQDGKYVNGSLGTVLSFSEGSGGLRDAAVRVLFDGHDVPVQVRAARWIKTQQVWSQEESSIVEKEIGSFSQLPLTPGYALTIHKAQGLSLDDVRIDLGRGAFAPGQLYVALSRARSAEGLSLARPIAEADVRVDDLLVAFLRWAKSASNLEFQSKIRGDFSK